MNWFSISTPPWSRELANFTLPIFFNWLLKFIWEYYMTRWSFNNALAQNRTPFGQLPKSTATNTDFVHFIYCTNIFNWPLNLVLLHGKKKKKKKLCLAKALTEPIDLMALWSAPNTSMQQSGSNWQRSDPMAYRHCQIDSTLAQWCWGSSGGGSHISGWLCQSLSQPC